jgi:hypothetical protein
MAWHGSPDIDMAHMWQGDDMENMIGHIMALPWSDIDDMDITW